MARKGNVKRTNFSLQYIHIPKFGASTNDHEDSYVNPASNEIMEVDLDNKVVKSFLIRGFITETNEKPKAKVKVKAKTKTKKSDK